MKPRIFIGSSVEGLEIAYAIQENLCYDANLTVWNQGVFQLSSNALDDLITALKNFDFGIFVFKPVDLVHIRDSAYNTVRDNVIFELGLFIGQLGKERVFFVLPEGVKDFHIPTDLLGVLGGSYKEDRDDNNLLAALGPFCNQVRGRIKDFILDCISDLVNENKEVKQIATEKKEFWKLKLFSALLRARMKDINESWCEIQKGYQFKETSIYNIITAINWIAKISMDYQRLYIIVNDVFLKDFAEVYESDGDGNVFKVKSIVQRIVSICKETMSWQVEIQSVVLPDDFIEIKQIMEKWASCILEPIIKLPDQIDYVCSSQNRSKEVPDKISSLLETPQGFERLSKIIDDLRQKYYQ